MRSWRSPPASTPVNLDGKSRCWRATEMQRPRRSCPKGLVLHRTFGLSCTCNRGSRASGLAASRHRSLDDVAHWLWV
jgi:hypothetical protein